SGCHVCPSLCCSLSTVLFPHRSRTPPHPHSLPTRRSSDLTANSPRRVTMSTRAYARSVSSCVIAVRSYPRVPTSSRVTGRAVMPDRKSTRLNSSHVSISYAVFCLKKKKRTTPQAKKQEQKP